MRALAAALLASAALLAAGCGEDDDPGCGLCGPPEIAGQDGAVWVAQERAVHRLDPETGRIDRTTEVLPENGGGALLEAVAVEGGEVRVATSSSVVTLSQAGRVLFREGRRPRAYASAMHAAGGHTLLAAGRRLLVLRADGSVGARSPRLPARVTALAVNGERAWVGGAGFVMALDVRTARPAGARAVASPWPGGLAAAGGRLWLSDGTTISGIDPATGATLRRLAEPTAVIALGEGALWTARRNGGLLTRRDPDSGEPLGDPLDPGDDATTLTAGAGGVWLGLRHPSVLRIDPSGSRIAWRRDIPVS